MNNEIYDNSAFEYWCKKVLKNNNTPLNRTHISEAFSTLSKRQKEYVSMRLFEGMSFTEIANTFCINVSTISRGVYSGKEKIKKYLKRRNPLLMCYFD